MLLIHGGMENGMYSYRLKTGCFYRQFWYNKYLQSELAAVAELADAQDLKSCEG